MMSDKEVILMDLEIAYSQKARALIELMFCVKEELYQQRMDEARKNYVLNCVMIDKLRLKLRRITK